MQNNSAEAHKTVWAETVNDYEFCTVLTSNVLNSSDSCFAILQWLNVFSSGKQKIKLFAQGYYEKLFF